MSRKKHESKTSEVLGEMEHLGDDLAGWAGRNPAAILGSALALLILAAGYGFFASARDRTLDRASSELARVDTEFRQALGTPPDTIAIVEPANPETARRVRADFVTRYARVAEDHAGTAIGAIAALEAGELHEALGNPDAALEVWRAAAEVTDPEEAASALLHMRLAALHEEAGRWVEAGEGYEAASRVEAYPLRQRALADAARCYAAAGEADRAIEVYERIDESAPGARVPDYIRAAIAELRARRDSATAAPTG